jgi:hypothetical protein
VGQHSRQPVKPNSSGILRPAAAALDKATPSRWKIFSILLIFCSGALVLHQLGTGISWPSQKSNMTLPDVSHAEEPRISSLWMILYYRRGMLEHACKLRRSRLHLVRSEDLWKISCASIWCEIAYDLRLHPYAGLRHSLKSQSLKTTSSQLLAKLRTWEHVRDLDSLQWAFLAINKLHPSSLRIIILIGNFFTFFRCIFSSPILISRNCIFWNLLSGYRHHGRGVFAPNFGCH